MKTDFIATDLAEVTAHRLDKNYWDQAQTTVIGKIAAHAKSAPNGSPLRSDYDVMGSALFGHEKGSFTGAVQAHKGYFEQASGGTLFLDEITETSEALQVSLLRVLETMKIMPVGGQRQIDVDVRVLASTNRDPRLAVQQGLLREDLYYRLNIFPILVPTLAERGADIVLLAKHFLSEHNKINKKNTQISAVALAYLQSLSYPGNVRQLKNRLYRAYILADEWIELEHLQES